MASHRGEEPFSKTDSWWKIMWEFPSLGVKLNSFSTTIRKCLQIPSWGQSLSAKKNSAATTGTEILKKNWFSDRQVFLFFFSTRTFQPGPVIYIKTQIVK